ncbi:hypothetical protein [Wolbachia endosymbiont of Pentidionis agamae]|uniref:hypothetical protein n=1 Tax=Wolbachia endosymbiont of Pentidionis agamae TaxID=3110435 RepID=UPI002FD28620
MLIYNSCASSGHGYCYDLQNRKMDIYMLGVSSRNDGKIGNHYMRLIKVELNHIDENGKDISVDNNREKICKLLTQKFKEYKEDHNVSSEQCILTLVELKVFSKAYCPHGQQKLTCGDRDEQIKDRERFLEVRLLKEKLTHI